MENVELAPLRSLDDYLLESARFKLPAMKDPERWANRVINNLLYYQTNYILTTIVTFLLVGIIHPVQMVMGFSAVSATFAIFVYATNNRPDLRRFKRDHPGVSIFIIVLCSWAFMYIFDAVITFLFGIALPLLVITIHASLRMRNIKNKIANKIEFVGLKRTPMGLFLEALGQEQEAGS